MKNIFEKKQPIVVKQPKGVSLVKAKAICKNCDGRGMIDDDTICPVCNGSGRK